jgi:hypothetical protein
MEKFFYLCIVAFIGSGSWLSVTDNILMVCVVGWMGLLALFLVALLVVNVFWLTHAPWDKKTGTADFMIDFPTLF